MWRTNEERAESAGERLRLADQVWHWQPHPSQGRLFCCPAQVKVAACGRRWGKTECLSIDVASLALAQARAGRECRQLLVAPTDAQARLLGAEVLRRVAGAFDAGTHWTDGLRWERRLAPALEVAVIAPGGVRCSVLCRTAARDGASLRGLWAHRIVVDEAALVPDVVLTDVLLPMLMDKGGEYVLASSPRGRRSAFFRLFARGENGNGEDWDGDSGAAVSFAAFRCPATDNPHNDRAFLENMREELGDAAYACEILAEFGDDAGAVFREDDIAGCLQSDDHVRAVRGELHSDPQPGRIYSAGVDWGRKVDFTVLAVLDATETPARLVHLRRWTGTGWDAQVSQIAADLARFGPLRVLCDGNAVGDALLGPLAEAVRAAQQEQADPPPVSVERFLFTADSKLQLIDRLTLGLSRRGLRFPAHPALLGELRGFEYGASGPTGRARMAARGAGHDDVVMALALAFWCAPEGLPEPPASLVLLGSMLRK